MSVRVLWVAKGLGPGGAEVLLAASAEHLDREQFHVDCAYVLPWKDHLSGRLEAAGVTTYCLSERRRDLRWPLRLVALVRGGGYDVLHVHSPLPGSVARVAARTMGRRAPRVIATEHNAWGTFRPATRWANRLTGRWNHTTFAVSDEVQRSVRGGAARTVRTLVHGIDVERTREQLRHRDAVRAELGIGARELVIGTVANFRPQKDHPNLLAAARRALDGGLDVRWVTVGQGPLEGEMRRRAEELGLGDRVVFTGFRDDATRVMAAFDVFTLASSWEGLPVALMEALALGLPVVATAVGGVAETLTDGVDGVLVPPSDAVALSDGWTRVCTDGALHARLASAASARAGEFDIGRAQSEIELVYGATPSAETVATASATAPSTSPRPPAAGIDIRPAEPADRAEVLALLQRSMHRTDDPRFAELYRWKHDDNPFGASPTWVAVADGRVVAVRAFMRWEFVRDGVVLRAVRAVDTATDPEYQGKGLFTALTLHGLEQMKADGVDFVFNTPNAQSLPGYLKMGWREVGRLPAAVRPIGMGGLARMARARVPSGHWSENLDVGVPFAEWLDGHPVPAPTPTPVRSLSTNVTEAYLRWRFGSSLLSYRALESDGGAVVVRMRRRGPAEELLLVESLGVETSVADRLALRAARAAGADYVLRLGNANPASGFLPLPGGGPKLTSRAVTNPGVSPLSNWALTMGDIELF